MDKALVRRYYSSIDQAIVEVISYNSNEELINLLLKLLNSRVEELSYFYQLEDERSLCNG